MLGEFLGIWNGWNPTYKQPPNAFSKTLEMFEKIHKIQWPCGAWLNFKRNLKASSCHGLVFSSSLCLRRQLLSWLCGWKCRKISFWLQASQRPTLAQDRFFVCVCFIYIYYFLIFIFYWTIISSSNLFKYKNMNCAFYNNNRANNIWLKVILDLC